MSVEMDFKVLWNKQPAGRMPDMKKLLANADSVKKAVRKKLVGLNFLLLATLAWIFYIGLGIDNIQVTTKIGIGIIAVAIISYLVAYDQLLPLLLKSNPLGTTVEYLDQLLIIKRKQDFLNKVMINVYFALLSVGMFLYMLQFTVKATTIGIILCYGITFGWIGFVWFYLRPRRARKKQESLNAIIVKLERVTGQLKTGD